MAGGVLGRAGPASGERANGAVAGGLHEAASGAGGVGMESDGLEVSGGAAVPDRRRHGIVQTSQASQSSPATPLPSSFCCFACVQHSHQLRLSP